jgi:hypothetical protein
MKIIVSIVGVIAVFWLLNVAYKRTNHFRKKFEHFRKFKEVPANLELVNFGSNYALFGFNYEGLGLNAFNFALGPQYLIYDFILLKKYAEHFRCGCVVLISFPPAVFCFDGVGRRDEKYYQILPRTLIPQYSWTKKITQVAFPLLSNPKVARFLIKDISASPVPFRANSEALCKEEAVARRDGWAKQFGLKDMVSDDFPLEVQRQFDKTITIVSEMIDFCLAQKFRPVLVIPPVSSSLRKLLGREFLNGALYGNIKKANGKNVPVLDYFTDEQFAEYSLYSNSDFMNETGARLFTKKVVRDLRSINYLPEGAVSERK